MPTGSRPTPRAVRGSFRSSPMGESGRAVDRARDRSRADGPSAALDRRRAGQSDADRLAARRRRIAAARYAGATPIYFYRAPDWKRGLVTEAEQGVVHAESRSRGCARRARRAARRGIHGRARVSLRRRDRGLASRCSPGDPAPTPLRRLERVAVGHLGADTLPRGDRAMARDQVVVYAAWREWERRSHRFDSHRRPYAGRRRSRWRPPQMRSS